ncbi:MAG: DUF6398 domain-containing protein [Chloroflexota bacterium]|nr:DUF6398 domain-containing protein [Chloroflexota bacterium]
MAKTTKSERVPKKMRAKFDEIMALVDQVCEEYLGEEYVQLARYATAALSRKRPSPLRRGRVDIWACGIVYALGTVNFLFDQSQDPHMSANELCAAFGVKKSSGANKAKTVRDALDMFQMDPHWCLPSQMDENPIAWMIMVDGLILDARRLPREIQEAAYEKGLIPYIPAS